MPDPSDSGARPLRLMPFLHSFEPGGVERVALRLCGQWARQGAAEGATRGIDVRLVMGRQDGAMRSESPPGLPIYMIPEPFPTAAWETIWLMIVLRREIRAQRPDVLFAAGNTYAIVAVAMKLALGRACPPVVMKVSNDLERRDLPGPVRALYRLWLRIQGRFIDHFTGLAEPMRAEIIAGMNVAAERVTIIDDPALAATDLAALAAIGAGRTPTTMGSRRYVSVGRLAGQKNYALLLRAFALAAGPADHLTIVGEGGERSRLQRLATTLGIGDRVAMPGHGAAPPALAAADVFVLSSDYEALPAVVVEALASGLPVVSTDCSVSMKSLVGSFGTVVPTGDAAALAAAMRAQPPLTTAQRGAAVAAMSAFTVERAAAAYAGLFVLAASRSGPQNAILAP